MGYDTVFYVLGAGLVGFLGGSALARAFIGPERCEPTKRPSPRIVEPTTEAEGTRLRTGAESSRRVYTDSYGRDWVI